MLSLGNRRMGYLVLKIIAI